MQKVSYKVHKAKKAAANPITGKDQAVLQMQKKQPMGTTIWQETAYAKSCWPHLSSRSTTMQCNDMRSGGLSFPRTDIERQWLAICTLLPEP